MQWSYNFICVLRSQQLSQNSKWPPFGSKLAFWDLTLIREALYFCWSYKLMGQLITGCLNWMKGICLQNKNVISGVKFCQFFSFDRQRPSWILRKIKNAYSSLWVRSSSMSVPNFVKIRWTGRICWAKMWFVGSNLVNFWTLTFSDHLEF